MERVKNIRLKESTMKNYQGVRKDLIDMTITSINACAVSLAGQLNDYDFLDVTPEQAKRLEKIYTELNKLVHEITG